MSAQGDSTTTTNNLDDDMLALLSPEERAAIAEDDMSEADRAAAQAIADEAADADPDADPDDDGDGDGDAGDGSSATDDKSQGADDAAASAPAPAPEPAQEVAEAPAQAPAAAPTRPRDEPVMVYNLPEGHAEKMSEARAAQDAAWKLYENGDIDQQELRAKLTESGDQIRELERVEHLSAVSQEMERQRQEREYRRCFNDLNTGAAQKDGLDYSKDEGASKMLHGYLGTLASRPENADQPMEWFMDRAHKMVMIERGQATPAPAPAVAAAPATPVVNGGKRTPIPAAAMPPNLSQVPGGEGPGDVDDKYADVLSLEGADFEEALSRMSPEARQRFLES